MMTQAEKKRIAQDLLMRQIANIAYGRPYEKYVEQIGDREEAERILFSQMSRIAKMMGYQKAWFA